jgi:hypothetical protein
MSILYGGMHYAFDNDERLTFRDCIGRTILDRVKFAVGNQHPNSF